MANADKFLVVVSRATGPICDDCMTNQAPFKRRQISRRVGEDLGNAGKVTRTKGTCIFCDKKKKVSALANGSMGAAAKAKSAVAGPVTATSTYSPAKPWFWEGNIQATLVKHLISQGYTIHSFADTASKKPGIDVVASSPEGRRLWVTVKGYPEDKPEKKTKPPTQARKWFSQAIFDLVLYHGQDPDVDLAMAIPAGVSTYPALAERGDWLRRAMPFTIYWVAESGVVRVS